MRKLTILLLILTMILALLFPVAVKTGVENGLNLWLFTIIPTLFPFMLISELIKNADGYTSISRILYPITRKIFGCSRHGSYVVISGLCCGYPMGAKSAADMIEKGKLDSREGEYLIGFCNCLSPSFIISYYSIYVLDAEDKKYVVMLYFMAIAIVTSVVMRVLYYRILSRRFLDKRHKKPSSDARTFSTSNSISVSRDRSKVSISSKDISTRRFELNFDKCFLLAALSTLILGGYIIVFSCINELISLFVPYDILKNILMCLTEITTGLKNISASSLPMSLKFIISSACISFGGISGLLQTNSIIKDSGLSIKKYLCWKLLATAETLICSIIYILFIC